jgi:site-specific DNA-methyltransferase (adenine-specific)
VNTPIDSRSTDKRVLRVDFEDGYAIRGSFPNPDVLQAIHHALTVDRRPPCFPLVVADPPYGNIVDEDWDRIETNDRKFCEWMIHWTMAIVPMLREGCALYVWGGVGRPHFRPFYRYLVEVEDRTRLTLANHITWSKKRAYGVQNNYLFTREELAYFILGDPKKPATFHIPLLETKRGYAGYNAKYPAKSEFFRRTNVWMDVTEIFRGKVHPTEKPARVIEIPVEVHTDPGDWVLDPFAGSGTTALAARKLGRKFIVVERDPTIFDQMVARIEKGILPNEASASGDNHNSGDQDGNGSDEAQGLEEGGQADPVLSDGGSP